MSVLRLWLVRHGESTANRGGLIAGQSDMVRQLNRRGLGKGSAERAAHHHNLHCVPTCFHQPLTETGREQARALGRSPRFQSDDGELVVIFWRMYASDLSRAHETARLVLGESVSGVTSESDAAEDGAGNAVASKLRIDPRLREKAYGAREGRLRDLSYDECLRQWEVQNIGAPAPPPFLESEDDLKQRAVAWYDELLREASQYDSPTSPSLDDSCPASLSVRHVLVVAHAGFIRQLLRHLIGYDRLRAHPRAAFDTTHADPRLHVSNASLSLVDVDLRSLKSRGVGCPSATLVELNCVRHLESLPSTKKSH